jgi:hypothetical protein
MGRPKKELRQIHKKKIRRAKTRLKAYEKREISYEKLSRLAQRLLAKKQRKIKKTV